MILNNFKLSNHVSACLYHFDFFLWNEPFFKQHITWNPGFFRDFVGIPLAKNIIEKNLTSISSMPDTLIGHPPPLQQLVLPPEPPGCFTHHDSSSIRGGDKRPKIFVDKTYTTPWNEQPFEAPENRGNPKRKGSSESTMHFQELQKAVSFREGTLWWQTHHGWLENAHLSLKNHQH